MKFIISLFLIILSSAICNAGSASVSHFNRQQKQFADCFNSYRCGDTRFELSSNDLGADDKEKLYYKIVDKCLPNILGDFKISYVPYNDDYTYKSKIESRDGAITSYIGCNPAKSFQQSIKTSTCEKSSDQKALAPLADICAYLELEKEILISELTSCSEKMGAGIQMTYGFSKNKKTNICERTCKKKGTVLHKKIKNGMTLGCHSEYGDCQFYRDDGTPVDGIIYSRPNIPAKYYDVRCISCSDSKVFTDSSYTVTTDSNGICFDIDGCPRGYEMVFNAEDTAGKRLANTCFPKCLRGSHRDERGYCTEKNLDEDCKLARKQYEYATTWNYHSLFKEKSIQSCSSKDIIEVVSLKMKTVSDLLSKRLSLCAQNKPYDSDYVGVGELYYINIINNLNLKDALIVSRKKCFNSSVPSGEVVFEKLYQMPRYYIGEYHSQEDFDNNNFYD